MKNVDQLKERAYEAKIKKLEKEIIKAMVDDATHVEMLEEDLLGLEEEVVDAGFSVENGVISWNQGKITQIQAKIGGFQSNLGKNRG